MFSILQLKSGTRPFPRFVRLLTCRYAMSDGVRNHSNILTSLKFRIRFSEPGLLCFDMGIYVTFYLVFCSFFDPLNEIEPKLDFCGLGNRALTQFRNRASDRTGSCIIARFYYCDIIPISPPIFFALATEFLICSPA